MHSKNEYLQIEPSNEFNKIIASALENGHISKDEWFELHKEYYSNLYLSKDNPRAQSGHSGDEFHYLYSHLMIIEAINKNGTFLDIGCANGYLLESVNRWASGIGYKIEFYGLDISERIINLAKQRLPEWKDHFYVGNALTWMPKYEFDFVCIKGLEYVPDSDQFNFFQHIMNNYLNDKGRLIFGPNWCDKNNDLIMDRFIKWGIEPNGFAEKSHYSKKNTVRKILWFDKM